MIRAEVHSDDRAYEIDFDATHYFEKASDREILELAATDWGGDYPGDEVARFFNLNPKIVAMFEYLEKHDMGFECHVNEKDAVKWLKEHRPKTFYKIEKLNAGPRDWSPRWPSKKKK